MRERWIAVLALVLLAACARTSGTVEIPPGELPFSVAREPSPAGTAAPTREITIFFVRGERLVPSRRRVEGAPGRAEAALRSLLDGPTRQERAAGIATELPSSVSLLAVEIAGDTVIVDLSGEFQEPATPERIALRVAQVTWTLTEVSGVREVAFAIDGEPVSVTTDDGMTVDRPVRRSDYARFAPTG